MNKLMAGLTVVLLASAGVAFAQGNNTPAKPNCTPGLPPGCQDYFTMTDHSDQNPTKSNNGAAVAPNCTPGQAGCKDKPTTDHSDDNPLHTGAQPQH